MDLVSLLIWLLVFCIVMWVIYYVVQQIPGLPPPIKNIALLIVGLIFLLILLSRLGVFAGRI